MFTTSQKIKCFLWLTLLLFVSACASPTLTPMVASTEISANAEEIIVTEKQTISNELTQKKEFDQCASDSSFKANIEFNQSSSQQNTEVLMIKGEGGGEIKVSSLVSARLGAAIEKHFATSVNQGSGHTESVNIEVPARTHQEYTITWRELRREGVAEYSENGKKNTANFSYRIGLELVSSSAKDLQCPDQQLNPAPTLTHTPPVMTEATKAPATPQKEADTAIGTHLKVGETWKKDGVHLTLKTVEFQTFFDEGRIFLEFAFGNFTGQPLAISLFRDNAVLELSNGDRCKPFYSSLNNAYHKSTINDGELTDVWFDQSNRYSWMCNYFNSNVNSLTITVRDWSRIDEAVWQVDIQH